MDKEIQDTIRNHFFKRGKYAIMLWLVVVYIFALYLSGPGMKKIPLASFMAGYLMFSHLFLLLFANWFIRWKKLAIFFGLQLLTTVLMAFLITNQTAKFELLVGFIPILVIEEIALAEKSNQTIMPLSLLYAGGILIFGLWAESVGAAFLLLESVVASWFVARYFYLNTYTRSFQSLQLKQANDEINEAYHEVARLTADEIRQKMARDLHDTITQDLVGINMQLTAIQTYLKNGDLEHANQKIKVVQDMTQAALTESRETITNYRQLPDNQVTTSLKYKVLEKTQLLKVKYDLETKLNIPEEIELGGDLLIDVLRMINEALVNVVKHAHTNYAEVKVQVIENRLVVEVYNDGETFHSSPSTRHGHYGLIGIRERAQSHGGDLKILSTPDDGTTVIFEVKM